MSPVRKALPHDQISQIAIFYLSPGTSQSPDALIQGYPLPRFSPERSLVDNDLRMQPSRRQTEKGFGLIVDVYSTAWPNTSIAQSSNFLFSVSYALISSDLVENVSFAVFMPQQLNFS